MTVSYLCAVPLILVHAQVTVLLVSKAFGSALGSRLALMMMVETGVANARD